ncbi:hypothetical protein BAUCODRAFT_438044 [Baudoinia panamericana UAMH 10762]|uniref:Uncharacterized protein n=1 Tax=Baudoinia panamericana (strain UAMH 10762) TaxID=717646 RepID=M2MZP1_BAUPA|nr:uncharacterized protein BAUCODRAFT_438044 [Baudoinia panamericana UAMH 10762]EMC97093.1 hypothetical protein BAUCODRAFT_438044 [Baudoinia panamericana UAMH 10762]
MVSEGVSGLGGSLGVPSISERFLPLDLSCTFATRAFRQTYTRIAPCYISSCRLREPWTTHSE